MKRGGYFDDASDTHARPPGVECFDHRRAVVVDVFDAPETGGSNAQRSDPAAVTPRRPAREDGQIDLRVDVRLTIESNGVEVLVNRGVAVRFLTEPELARRVDHGCVTRGIIVRIAGAGRGE